MQDNKNILLATVLSAIILILCTWFYEKPRAEEFQRQQLAKKELEISAKKDLEKQNLQKKSTKNNSPKPTTIANSNSQATKILLDSKKAVKDSKNSRIKVKSKNLNGSINLQGAIFDDLSLNNYHQTIEKNSPNVLLFAPKNSKDRYFANFGWVSSNENLDLPNAKTLWQSDSDLLTPNNPVTLSWKNKQNIIFMLKISIDENYMFNIEKSVLNKSGQNITLAPYGRINRLLKEEKPSNYILHEGPIGVFDGILEEMQYKDLIEENNQKFESKKNWFGITDKYWLSAIILDQITTNTLFNYEDSRNGKIYDVSFIGEELEIENDSYLELNQKLFAGAKEVQLLDEYAKKYNIDLFDRSVDFGWYYFLTKPFFFILKFFNQLFGNYGLAILAITVLIKIAMLPLATKSYSAMARIKKLHPNIEEIKNNNKDSKMQMNKEIMELYKREGVNPASGCLPMLIQIPVFFSLYKILFVTIDMRHQPFFGWIKDLSAPDPTSIFNLFGLLPFEITGGILLIGIWPILMGLTMILQQKLGPKITDPTQAKVMKILPLVLIFIFAAFPAGLLIYWTWNNILSIIQQYVVTKKIEAEMSK